MELSQDWQYLSLEGIPTHLSLMCPGTFKETLILGPWSYKAPNIRILGNYRDLRLKIFDFKFLLRMPKVETDEAASPLRQSEICWGGRYVSFLTVQFV